MEYEIKFRTDSTAEVRGLLQRNGFTRSASKHQVDTYFIVNDRQHGKPTYLRVRVDKLTGKSSLDYHIVHSDVMTEEIEVQVSDSEVMKDLLLHMGFSVRCIVNKRREEYVKDEVKIVLDEVAGLGSYVEIEMDVDDERMLLASAKGLGLQEKDRITRQGYPDMIIQHTSRME